MAVVADDLKVGARLPDLVKHIEQRHIDLFEDWEPSAGKRTRGNYHTDADAAREALGGFEKPIASGRMEVEWGLQALGKWFGRDAASHSGRVDLRFLVPVVAGDTLTVCGTVTYVRERDSGTTVNTEMWLQNGKGQKVAVGTAGVRLS